MMPGKKIRASIAARIRSRPRTDSLASAYAAGTATTRLSTVVPSETSRLCRSAGRNPNAGSDSTR